MARIGYSSSTPAGVALVAATAKTVLTVSGGTTFGIDLKKISLGFDGTTANVAPVLVELCAMTGATTGTATALTPTQDYGRSLNAQASTQYNYSAEPTVLTAIRRWLVTPYSSTVLYDFPLGDSPDCGVGPNGFALRMTAAAAVNAWAGFTWERC